MILKNATILTSEGNFVQSDLSFTDTINIIGDCEPAFTCNGGICGMEIAMDVTGHYIVPGLIDIHTHGAMGVDTSDGKEENLEILSKYYASQGVTSWCPTTMTLPEEVLLQAVKSVAAYKNPIGAKPVGIYLEGPFFHYDKKGAQSASHLALPDYGFFKRLQEASGGLVSVLALAPELKNALDVIEEVSKEVTVSLGHTTTDYDTAMEAFDKGATLVTHLYNGMQPFSHRAPGLIGAAADKNVYVELICDGLHIHPSVIRATHKLFGKKLCLISDSLRCAGMADGEYELGGQPISKNGSVARLHDGTLAGSSIGLLEGVRNVISFGISPEDAFYAGSTAPSQAIGKSDSIGSIEVGKSADFLVLDKNFNLIATYVNGNKVFGEE